MYKKYINLIIYLSIIVLSLTGCSKSKGPYDVPKNGGSFSQNDLIYFIMTDRFNDGDLTNDHNTDKNDPSAFHGGDFKGITQKLDYIKSLGTTAIWITPAAQNDAKGYHGYWIDDFYKVDSHLGTMADLKDLVKSAHKRNIKVILDYVANHTGYETAWLNDGKHKNWFHRKGLIVDYNDPSQVENGWLAGLPDLNQDNPEVKNYLINNAIWWIDQTGIDGMRLDTVKHVPKDFWNEFAYKIKIKYPDFYLIGEVWNNDASALEPYHQAGIDGLLNYPMYDGIKNTFKNDGSAYSLVRAIKSQSSFSKPGINGIFIDNHDNKRFITDVENSGGNGEAYMKQALSFIMTYPQIPIIYYGTEIAMPGGNDPDNRNDMNWNSIKDSRMLSFYKMLVSLRSSNPALISGKFELLDYDANYISYMRIKGSDSVIVIMNLQNSAKNITIDTQNSSEKYVDKLSGAEFKSNSGKLSVSLKPLDLLILESR